MEKPFEEAPPNVVSENGLRKDVKHGWLVEVVCRQTPEKRAYNWYGEWTIRIVSPDGTREKHLVTTREDMEFRIFKTTNSVISFLLDLGYPEVVLPLQTGMRSRQRREA